MLSTERSCLTELGTSNNLIKFTLLPHSFFCSTVIFVGPWLSRHKHFVNLAQLPGEYVYSLGQPWRSKGFPYTISTSTLACTHLYPWLKKIACTHLVYPRFVAQRHECYDRGSNPHSADQKHHSLSQVLLSAQINSVQKKMLKDVLKVNF